MKIIHNKEKYKVGTKFNLLGVPSIVIAEGIAMAYDPIYCSKWTDIIPLTKEFQTRYGGKWHMPSKEEVTNALHFLLKQEHMKDKWLWTSTKVGDHSAYDFDFKEKKFFTDHLESQPTNGCTHMFYSIFD